MVLPDFLPNDEIDQISSTLSIPKHPYYEDRLAKRQFKINIQNVVGLANLNQRIDLDSVTRQFQSVEYKPDVFPAIVYRSKKPNVVILLFATGKLVVVGAKSERQVKKAVSKIANELGAKGITVLGKSDVAIRNVVASAELGCQIDLEDAANIDQILFRPIELAEVGSPRDVAHNFDSRLSLVRFNLSQLWSFFLFSFISQYRSHESNVI